MMNMTVDFQNQCKIAGGPHTKASVIFDFACIHVELNTTLLMDEKDHTFLCCIFQQY